MEKQEPIAQAVTSNISADSEGNKRTKPQYNFFCVKEKIEIKARKTSLWSLRSLSA